MKQYTYVGPEDIRQNAKSASAGVRIVSIEDLSGWLTANHVKSGGAYLPATFVIDLEGFLRLADRRSEHVTCAAGLPVLSALEIAFEVERNTPVVETVTNQSTGYCPEPESWPVVAATLDGIGVRRPEDFTMKLVFRRCPKCSQTNVVKDGWFECGVCGSALPETWNF